MLGYLHVQACLPVKTAHDLSMVRRVVERLFVHVGLRHTPIQA